MRLLPLIAIAALAACASPQQPCPCPCAAAGPTRVEVPAPSPPAGSASADLPSPAGPGNSPCWAAGLATKQKAATKEHVYCGPLDATEMARVEAQLRRDIPQPTPSKLIVDFGCDAAYQDWKEVFFEDGSGHGGSLRIVRFRREPDHVSVRTIASSHYHAPAVTIEAASVSIATFETLLARSRVALIARPHVVRLVVKSGSFGMSGISSSSNDFHLRMSIIDQSGSVTDREFTGYDGSDREVILPMRMATQDIQKLLKQQPATTQAVIDEDKRMFTERFLITMGGDPYWWVAERYIRVAATLGTVDLVPKLVQVTQRKGDASVERQREYALTVITAITGWDPRLAPDGSKRTVDEAAAVVAEACKLPD